MVEILNRDCECWRQTASLNIADRSFPKEAIRHIYCPSCSKGIQKNVECMAEEKGWVIEYDPNLLRPASATVHIVQHRRNRSSFLIYMKRGKRIGGLRRPMP